MKFRTQGDFQLSFHRIFNHVLHRAVVSALCLASGVGVLISASEGANADGAKPKVKMTVEISVKTLNKKTGAEVTTKKPGVIEIELYASDAPKTVAHFLDLTKKKFYDGMLFHRFVQGFVVQTGDPKSKTTDIKTAVIQSNGGEVVIQGLGEGGSGTNVPLEAKAAHDRGTIGLARSSAPDSGDSQFFFNLKGNNSLDAGYCSFGKVTKGLDVMDKLRTGDKIVSLRSVVAPKPGKMKK